MTHPAVTTKPDETIADAAHLMYAFKVKRLPVVDPDGTLVGIISRADVLAVFDRSDRDIHREITQDLMLEQILVDPEKFMVSVENGVVTLSGVPETWEVGRQIVRLVRHVPGVIGVRDQLTYPPAKNHDVFDVLAEFPTD